jgi:hypothetical protein
VISAIQRRNTSNFIPISLNKRRDLETGQGDPHIYVKAAKMGDEIGE